MIFISHSRENSHVALGLCKALRDLGREAWLDVLDARTHWSEDVSRAVKMADAFVFVIGPPGPSDRWQQFEWEQVLNRGYYLDPGKPFVPVLIGRPETPGFLKVRRFVEVDKEHIDFSTLAERVVEMLESGDTIDSEKLRRARESRRRELQHLVEHAKTLERQSRGPAEFTSSE